MQIKCEECGNDGLNGGLYLTLDARYEPETQTWTLQRREDLGGDELDCINCDHRTRLNTPNEVLAEGVVLSLA